MLATWTARRALFGLAIALGIGLVSTTRATAQEGRRNDGQKRYVIEFDRAPWKTVFERLSDISGLAFRNSDDSLPTGTFTFINPKVNGVNKTYTVAEAFEIVNDGLAPRYTLLRRGAGFTVVPAGEPLDEKQVPQVTREELYHHGRNDIVIFEQQLRGLDAEELAPEAKKFLGKFGEVTPLPTTNQLILQGTAEKLRRWLEITEELCKPGPFETYQHVCEYVKASRAEKVLRDFLGDPQKVEIIQRPNAVQPGGKGARSNDPAPSTTMNKHPSYHIASDERTNTIYVNGPPEKIAQAKQLMAKFDVPQYGGSRPIPGPPVFQTYSIPAGNAEAIAKMLTEVYKASPTLRFTATSSTVLLVFGLPREQMEIASLLTTCSLSPANGKEGLVSTTQGTAPERRPNDGQKRHALEFDRTPWKTVFERLSDISGLAFRNSDDALPTGTFTFINPKVNGVNKTYTVAEAFEVVNDGLAPRYTLLRRGASFRVVPADVPIDKELLQQVTREELARRGRNEIVIVEVQLKTLNAKDLAPKAKKYLGAFSEVTPLPLTNQLIVQGKVEQLRRWLDVIEENDKTGPFETYDHRCKNVKASQAEKVLRDFLGDPKKSRSYHIASDDRTNTIYVNGPPEKVEQVKNLMARLDVPPIALGPPTFRTYAIPAGNADAIAKILADVHKASPTLRFTATSGTVLLVYGLPSEHVEIATLLAPLNIPPANGKEGLESRDVVRFAKRPPRLGRDMRRRPESSRRSVEARLDRLIAEVEALRREVRGHR